MSGSFPVIFIVQIPPECGIPINVTIILKESGSNIDEFTSNVTQDSNGQIMASRKLEDLLNQHLQAVAFVKIADGSIVTTEIQNFSKLELFIHTFSPH